jgi:hypothetical protein
MMAQQQVQQQVQPSAPCANMMGMHHGPDRRP